MNARDPPANDPMMPERPDKFDVHMPDVRANAEAVRDGGLDALTPKNSSPIGRGNTRHPSMAEMLRQQELRESAIYLAGVQAGKQQERQVVQQSLLLAQVQASARQHRSLDAAVPFHEQKMPARQHTYPEQHRAAPAWNQEQTNAPSVQHSATSAVGSFVPVSGSTENFQRYPRAERMDTQNERASMSMQLSDPWDTYMVSRAVESPPLSGGSLGNDLTMQNNNPPQLIDYEQWYNSAANSKASATSLVDICKKCISYDAAGERTSASFWRFCNTVVEQDGLRKEYRKLMNELRPWRDGDVTKKRRVIDILCAFIDLGDKYPNRDFHKRAKKIHRCKNNCTNGIQKILDSSKSPSAYSCSQCGDQTSSSNDYVYCDFLSPMYDMLCD